MLTAYIVVILPEDVRIQEVNITVSLEKRMTMLATSTLVDLSLIEIHKYIGLIFNEVRPICLLRFNHIFIY